MDIYHYHPDSAVYLGCSCADASPLEPGVFLIPAQATAVAPPTAKEGEHAVFDGADWALSPLPSAPPAPPSPLPPTAAQWLTIAISQRDQLLTAATLAMAPLQDAVELGDATPTEIALLTQWKQYRVAVNRAPNQDDFPHAIAWPLAPDAVATALIPSTLKEKT
jgi:hypothetical protein